MTVYDYFRDRLGVEPRDLTLKELLTDDVCGYDCVRVVDIAALLIAEVHRAYGNDCPSYKQSVRTICEEVVTMYWRG